jgi:DNA-binding transcriptional MerR regulator
MTLTVGAAARAAGVSAKAVRLWEAKGLLPPAERTEAGYRMFTDDDLDVLRFIRQAKTLGLTLPEIKTVIDLQRAGTTPCGRVTELLDTHIAEIDRAIGELRHLRRSLAAAREAALDSQRRGQHVTVCRIIETATTRSADPTAGDVLRRRPRHKGGADAGVAATDGDDVTRCPKRTGAD